MFDMACGGLRAVLVAWLISLSFVDDGLALPSGFTETTALSGLMEPTVVEFAADGRVFVAEKAGLIKVFDSLSDPSPTIFADLRIQVHNFIDRGLLGMALDPGFTTGRPYVYVLYTYNAAIGGTAPRWPTIDGTSDNCPNPPGGTTDGCVVSARMSRLQASGNTVTGPEQVLIEDWCQQYPSHSIGTLTFGTDGALYISGGDGASYNFADWGQEGIPVNPCADPPAGLGGAQTPPSAEGGALRSQSLRRAPGEPIALSGAVLRVNPDTGAALPNNPLSGHSNANARRIVAYGLRNPFRIAARPGTNELWVGDVGWGAYEEINRFRAASTSPPPNFGWPCYEGAFSADAFDAPGLSICDGLYADPNAHTPPLLAYHHNDPVASEQACPTGSSSISGLAFYNGGSYPSQYNGALFFADYSRNCIWVMFNPPPPLPDSSGPPVAVAAYGFNESGGTSILDGSGNSQGGTISGAGRTGAGAYNSALSFDGLNDWVTVADSSFLDLTTGMTVEAWVNPTALTGWRTVLMKEGASDETYTLNASAGSNLPQLAIATSTGLSILYGTAQLPLNTWTHLAGTYDGSTLRLYVNGNLVASRVVTGSIRTSAQPLRIGGNGLWGEYFQGTIDEVRVYDRALTQGQIQTDMNTPVPAGASAMTVATFHPGASGPVDLTVGPGGDLFYVDFNGGRIMRVQHAGGNQPPVATTQGSPLSGPAPLTVAFSAAGSSDPEGSPLTYAWDLDGDGQFDDGSSAQASYTYAATGTYLVRLRVTDGQGATGISTPLSVTVGTLNTAPTATILTPSATTAWKVGDTITFSGAATDPQDGTLGASAFAWKLIIHHCPSNCHTHPMGDIPGVLNGSFSAPDHEYPSHLEIQLTVTDSGGLTNTKSVLIYPAPVTLSFQSNPSGLALAVGATSQATPFSRTVIVGSTNSLSAASPQTLGATTYQFVSWSDGGAQSHNVTAPASAATFTATFAAPLDTTPPTITSVTPAAGAGNVSVGANLTVTFSEAMDAATVNTATVELRNPSGVVVPATVSYAAATRTATLDPTGTLTAGVTYTARVKGGGLDPRVKDVAGNALAADLSWVFTAGTGLVAAYGFNEASGSTVADASGNGHTGTIFQATRTVSGKYGGALTFDGSNDWVTVSDSNLLDLTTGMTLSAWVYPTALGGWRTVIMKQATGNEIYTLNSNTGANRPQQAIVTSGGLKALYGTAQLPANTWTHLAGTYDGTTLRVYVNGTQVASQAVTGAMLTSTGPLRIGGNSIWGEFFAGRIDEIRIYSRALAPTEIQTDMNAPLQ